MFQNHRPGHPRANVSVTIFDKRQPQKSPISRGPTLMLVIAVPPMYTTSVLRPTAILGKYDLATRMYLLAIAEVARR